MTTKSPPKTRDDTQVAAISAAVISAFFIAFALGIFGARAAASVAIGAVAGIANLVALRATVRALLTNDEAADDEAADAEAASGPSEAPESEPEAPTKEESKATRKRYGAAWGVFALLKMFLLFGGIWLLLTKHVVDPLPLVVGYGVMPIGIVVSTLVSALRVPNKRRR